MDFNYEGYFPSTMKAAEFFLKHIAEQLDIALQNRELAQEARLVISELVVNGTLHGNACDSRKHVFVRLKINPTTIWIQVEDEGKGIQPGKKKDILSTSGRGLHIVRCLADEFNIKDNRITVEIYR